MQYSFCLSCRIWFNVVTRFSPDSDEIHTCISKSCHCEPVANDRSRVAIHSLSFLAISSEGKWSISIACERGKHHNVTYWSIPSLWSPPLNYVNMYQIWLRFHFTRYIRKVNLTTKETSEVKTSMKFSRPVGIVYIRNTVTSSQADRSNRTTVTTLTQTTTNTGADTNTTQTTARPPSTKRRANRRNGPPTTKIVAAMRPTSTAGGTVTSSYFILIAFIWFIKICHVVSSITPSCFDGFLPNDPIHCKVLLLSWCVVSLSSVSVCHASILWQNYWK